ncbi:5-oxoprolinase subunit PxpB [Clostridium estertheticum]|uniref:5-oxoprolinase subunit PxpB n=1 Tax=Clostridium estertheticum TaxID=238834 RepID=A0AA47EJK9_9CLOT|nr:5-oxoprolinase subunit PxpB [Clostridium estertheticum]MBU3153808.1 5-oxoprolinase subunit PxpB [Clostridium estertheticum]MBU3198559.1 5-oxoprolinase subunit PxpB [Clostridium estertheticum]WAG61409.1 5-oxoprolinase subunit PxpB [Clostridium estertheticum]WAG64538.1 5-oxoprolinase subunit PxpB [Clostridium estertheticum]
MYEEVKYLIAGDRALVVEFGDKIEEQVNSKIRSLTIAMERAGIVGINEIIPTYRSLMVIYDPMIMELDNLIGMIKSIISKMHELKLPDAKVIEVPTLYGGEYGPDIDFVAKHNKISVDEVIKIHTSVEYLIYMIGFTPGFPYLGGMSDKIEAPRLQNPRTKIPAQSVGIAGKQTGIYPIESPGGWQLIGRTPVKLYDPFREDPVLLNAGDYIKFVQIDENEYKNIEALERDGKYKVIIREKLRR